MKILQLIQKPQNRGAEMFTCQLSNHLVTLGNQIIVVAIFDGDGILPFKGKISSLSASENRRFFDVSAWRKLSHIIKKFQPDVIQVNAGDTLKYAVFSKILFNWNTPIISRNASEIGRYLKSPIQKKINSFFYKKVNSVISVSNASERDILNHFPFLKGRTTIIPVGLEYISEIKEIELKQAGKHSIIHVGGFTFEKNHFGLLRIFKNVLSINKHVHLHLIGDGPLKFKIEKEVKIMGLSPYVTFYGFVNNPLSYIKQGDVLVLPSVIEGLPGVLLEAMYCKTPTIAYNVGGISEIVGSTTGYLIEKGDETSFAAAILETLENKNSDQIENAHHIVVNNYMNNELAVKFHEFYENVIY